MPLLLHAVRARSGAGRAGVRPGRLPVRVQRRPCFAELTRSPHILVVGAGIAGLAVASFLARAGMKVTVREKLAEPPTAGAGIQVSPNAAKVLRLLGVLDALRKRSVTPDAIELMDGPSGRRLSRFELGASVHHRYGAPYLLCARAALRDVLDAALPSSAHVEYASGSSNFESTADGVDVATGDRTTRFDAVIGADGVGSSVRRQIENAPAIIDTGKVAWRRTDALTAVPSITQVCLYPDEHRVDYPIPGGTNTVWIRDAAASAPGEGWAAWRVLETGADGRWTQGRMTLLGDAAHAMPPYAAQGGAMALEDAAVLAAEMVSQPHDLSAAFIEYERKRRPRVRAVARLTAANRRIYHMGGVLALARNVAMRAAPQAALQRRMQPVFAWEPPSVRPRTEPTR